MQSNSGRLPAVCNEQPLTSIEHHEILMLVPAIARRESRIQLLEHPRTRQRQVRREIDGHTNTGTAICGCGGERDVDVLQEGDERR